MMKRYAKEAVLAAVQLFFFYIFPLFAGPADGMGMVVVILLATFVLSVLMGGISKLRARYLYAPLTALLFVPSVFIHYNDSALIHAAWYLAVSAVGVGIGALGRYLACRMSGSKSHRPG